MPEQNDDRNVKIKKLLSEFYNWRNCFRSWYSLPIHAGAHLSYNSSISACCGSKVFNLNGLLSCVPFNSIVSQYSFDYKLEYYRERDFIFGFSNYSLDQVKNLGLFDKATPGETTFLDLSRGKYGFILAYKDI